MTGETRYRGPSGAFPRSNLQLLRNGLSSGAKTPAPAQFTWRNPLSRPFGFVSPGESLRGLRLGARQCSREEAGPNQVCFAKRGGAAFHYTNLQALVGCASSWPSLRSFRLSPEKPALRPFGCVSPGKGSTLYAGCGVPRPWGSAPNPALAAGWLEGVGGKGLPNTPGLRLVVGGAVKNKAPSAVLRTRNPRGAPRLSS